MERIIAISAQPPHETDLPLKTFDAPMNRSVQSVRAVIGANTVRRCAHFAVRAIYILRLNASKNDKVWGWRLLLPLHTLTMSPPTALRHQTCGRAIIRATPAPSLTVIRGTVPPSRTLTASP